METYLAADYFMTEKALSSNSKGYVKHCEHLVKRRVADAFIDKFGVITMVDAAETSSHPADDLWIGQGKRIKCEIVILNEMIKTLKLYAQLDDQGLKAQPSPAKLVLEKYGIEV